MRALLPFTAPGARVSDTPGLTGTVFLLGTKLHLPCNLKVISVCACVPGEISQGE